MKKIVQMAAACFLTLGICGCFSSNSARQVSVDGSTSMEKVIGSLGEMYELENDGVKFTYNSTGSSTGITAVYEERCDIGLSSRWLKEEEKEKGLTETLLALDGIALVVNPDNPVSDISLEEVTKIFSGEIVNWSEVNGQDSTIVLIGREAGSGTRDGFESITGTVSLCNYRQELTSAGDVITAVSNNPDAVGYVSTASVSDSVKILKISGIAPTEETIRNGSYVIQRPFLLITKADKSLEGAAREFFEFAISSRAWPVIEKAGAVAVGKENL